MSDYGSLDYNSSSISKLNKQILKIPMLVERKVLFEIFLINMVPQNMVMYVVFVKDADGKKRLEKHTR